MIVLLWMALAYLAVCALVFVFQARLVYFPGGPPQETPRAHGLTFEEVWLELPTGAGVERAHGWWIETSAAQPARGVILFCHGNGGAIQHRLGTAEFFAACGFDVLLFDYRGYGASDGRPSERGTYEDALAAYDFARARGVPPERILAYGESLGGAISIHLARERELAGLFVESTFTSLPDVGAKAYPFLPVRLLSRFRYDSLSKVAEIGCPLLVAHSPDDDLVPFSHGRALFEAAREPREFLRTEGGHNGGGHRGRPEWRAQVQRFLVDAASD